MATSELNYVLMESILEDLKLGLFPAQVAIKNGVSKGTLKHWVERGLRPDAEEPYRSFSERYCKIEIGEEAASLEVVRKAAKDKKKKKSKRQLKRLTSVDHSGNPIELGAEGGFEAEVTEVDEDVYQTGNVSAATWFLEHRWPKRWGNKHDIIVRDDIDILQLLEDAESRGDDIDELLNNPTPELEEAMIRNKDAIIAFLNKARELPGQ